MRIKRTPANVARAAKDHSPRAPPPPPPLLAGFGCGSGAGFTPLDELDEDELLEEDDDELLDDDDELLELLEELLLDDEDELDEILIV